MIKEDMKVVVAMADSAFEHSTNFAQKGILLLMKEMYSLMGIFLIWNLVLTGLIIKLFFFR